MLGFDGIRIDPNILGGKARIRGMRISVSLVVNLVANGMTAPQIVAEGDVVILKTIQLPPMSEFDDIVKEARRQARRAGMKRADVQAAIEAVRPGR